MKKLMVLLMGLSLVACQTMPEEETPSGPMDSVSIDALIPYADNNKIAGNIKQECRLPEKLSEFLVIFGKKYRINFVQKASVSSNDPGKVLKVRITDALSQGHAWGGFGGGHHNKFTEISGELYENGKKIGSFVAARSSGGGAFAGFKGSCSVLGRTVKALGKDVARWLRRPELDSRLGER
ncbi:MAG: hypothetical protein OEZ68_08770 [Gammaproteobacteria bacterium]|nr:hypothetical protein [Gammaproteobacteria bacterium]MDH5800879.1 hypothetical protein [Gammaproteobacteria bacterium]